MGNVGRISTALWLFGLGFVALVVWQMVLGALGLAEVVSISIAAVVVAALFTIHSVRVHRALHDHGHPDHRRLMDGLHRHREVRGF